MLSEVVNVPILHWIRRLRTPSSPSRARWSWEWRRRQRSCGGRTEEKTYMRCLSRTEKMLSSARTPPAAPASSADNLLLAFFKAKMVEVYGFSWVVIMVMLLVMKAVIENVKLKQQIFADLESTIDLNLIGEKTKSQDHIVGAHFFTCVLLVSSLYSKFSEFFENRTAILYLHNSATLECNGRAPPFGPQTRWGGAADRRRELRTAPERRMSSGSASRRRGCGHEAAAGLPGEVFFSREYLFLQAKKLPEITPGVVRLDACNRSGGQAAGLAGCGGWTGWISTTGLEHAGSERDAGSEEMQLHELELDAVRRRGRKSRAAAPASSGGTDARAEQQLDRSEQPATGGHDQEAEIAGGHRGFAS